jgi:hypothetical protein
MKAVLDACVIFPTVLRELLIGVAAKGLYEPLWSERILREWALAVRKFGLEAQVEAETQALLMRAAFPRAMVREQPAIEGRILLPDQNDHHVLADLIVTFNAKDFPRHVLAEEGIARRDPDSLLWELWSHHPGEVGEVVHDVHATAERLAGEKLPLKALLKRAKLPKLAKAMGL